MAPSTKQKGQYYSQGLPKMNVLNYRPKSIPSSNEALALQFDGLSRGSLFEKLGSLLVLSSYFKLNLKKLKEPQEWPEDCKLRYRLVTEWIRPENPDYWLRWTYLSGFASPDRIWIHLRTGPGSGTSWGFDPCFFLVQS